MKDRYSRMMNALFINRLDTFIWLKGKRKFDQQKYWMEAQTKKKKNTDNIYCRLILTALQPPFLQDVPIGGGAPSADSDAEVSSFFKLSSCCFNDGAMSALRSVIGESIGGRSILSWIGGRTSMTSSAFDLSTTGFSGSGGFSLLWKDLAQPC